MSKAAIEASAKQRRVPRLMHFTRVDNLASIMKHGIYSVAAADLLGIEAIINDQHRFDGQRGASCLSIAFPNYKMFYRLRMENPEVDWVVLGIEPSVLWATDSAFCRHNAADSRITCLDVESLKTGEAFDGLFDELEGHHSRADAKLHPYDPTDPQAEVLVFDVIDPKHIFGAAFQNEKAMQAHGSLLGSRKVADTKRAQRYFSARWYVRGGRSDG